MTDDTSFGGDAADDGFDAQQRCYFRHRADWHRVRAQFATDAGTRALHDRFAAIYDAKSMA